FNRIHDYARELTFHRAGEARASLWGLRLRPVLRHARARADLLAAVFIERLFLRLPLPVLQFVRVLPALLQLRTLVVWVSVVVRLELHHRLGTLSPRRPPPSRRRPPRPSRL